MLTRPALPGVFLAPRLALEIRNLQILVAGPPGDY
jgi:hypothetical protein